MDMIQIESNWQDTVIATDAPFEYELSDLDKLCLKCNLPDCKENSKKCPINIAKAAAKKAK